MANEKLGSFVSISWLCSRAGISRQRIAQLISTGKLAASFASGRWWVRDEVAKAFVEGRRQRPGGGDDRSTDDGERAA